MEKLRSATEERRRALALALALIGIVAAGFAVLLMLDDDTTSDPTAAEVVSVDSLREAAEEAGTPIYWAGARAGTDLELSTPEESRTYVRYLTGGAEAGDDRGAFLTVGTYATPDPVAELRRQGEEPGGVLGSAPGSATVYFDSNRPQSVYLAYPGAEAQIEVYDPDFKRALQIVNSGQVVPAE